MREWGDDVNVAQPGEAVVSAAPEGAEAVGAHRGDAYGDRRVTSLGHEAVVVRRHGWLDGGCRSHGWEKVMLSRHACRGFL